MSRDDAVDFAKRHGAKVTRRVTDQTDYLVVGETGFKLEEGCESGVLKGEEAFKDLVKELTKGTGLFSTLDEVVVGHIIIHTSLGCHDSLRTVSKWFQPLMTRNVYIQALRRHRKERVILYVDGDDGSNDLEQRPSPCFLRLDGKWRKVKVPLPFDGPAMVVSGSEGVVADNDGVPRVVLSSVDGNISWRTLPELPIPFESDQENWHLCAFVSKWNGRLYVMYADRLFMLKQCYDHTARHEWTRINTNVPRPQAINPWWSGAACGTNSSGYLTFVCNDSRQEWAVDIKPSRITARRHYSRGSDPCGLPYMEPMTTFKTRTFVANDYSTDLSVIDNVDGDHYYEGYGHPDHGKGGILLCDGDDRLYRFHNEKNDPVYQLDDDGKSWSVVPSPLGPQGPPSRSGKPAHNSMCFLSL